MTSALDSSCFGGKHSSKVSFYNSSLAWLKMICLSIVLPTINKDITHKQSFWQLKIRQSGFSSSYKILNLAFQALKNNQISFIFNGLSGFMLLKFEALSLEKGLFYLQMSVMINNISITHFW